MGSCLFCGSTDGPFTTEHVIPKWARKLVDPLDRTPLRVYAGEEPGADQRRKLGRLLHLSVTVDDAICRSCNNGVLSQLENQALPVLAPMIQTGRPTVLGTAEQAVLAAWATKTVWLLEHAARQMYPGQRPIEGYMASEVEFAWLWRERTPPPRALVWLAYWDCERQVPLMYEPSGATLPTIGGGSRPGHMTTLSLGYVAFQVFSTDFVLAEHQRAVQWNTRPPPALANAILRIWPSLHSRVAWPVAKLLRNEWTRLVQWDGKLRPVISRD